MKAIHHNTQIDGDNLLILREHVQDESVDLVARDRAEIEMPPAMESFKQAKKEKGPGAVQEGLGFW